MTKQKQQTGASKAPNKKKQKMARHSKFLLFAIVIALIPFVWVSVLLIQAALQTGVPIHGQRYAGDLNPAITDTQLADISTQLKGADGVEDVSSTLFSSTLRVIVDVKDDMKVDDVMTLAAQLSDKVFGVLDQTTYFSQSGLKKMYDLEVYVVDRMIDKDTVPTIAVLLHKTAGMEAFEVEVLSQAKNQEYVDSLSEEKEKTTEKTGG